MSRVNLDTLRPWITTKVTEMLGVEDDVLIEFICNQLEEEEVKCFTEVSVCGFVVVGC